MLTNASNEKLLTLVGFDLMIISHAQQAKLRAELYFIVRL